MSADLLSRALYDVRFLPVPDKKTGEGIDTYIASHIHAIYPGNNGVYEYRYRILGDKLIIIVFLSKKTADTFSGKPPYIPVFTLPDILKKHTRITSVNLYAEGTIEQITIEEGLPVRSQIVQSDDEHSHWVFFTPPGDEDLALPPKERIIPQPRLSIHHRYLSQKGTGQLSFTTCFSLCLLILLLIAGITTRYATLIGEKQDAAKRIQNEIMRADTRNSLLSSEIQSLEESADDIAALNINSPYRMIEALYTTAGRHMEIERITIQQSKFSIDCISEDPIRISDLLSKNTLFSHVSIQRIQEYEGRYKFSLTGRYDG
ncbi:hypothetical protein [Sediminispirochaeta bajacaliforniensis]|uniref:hypothetical protein n=1 Tax=Sediminispirochaeta bajacaliforniensis TaxID=148 RepID=UPI0003611563|nr:hypothetical protein [Sediminispirochaeta bajacaliforniensis]